MTNYSTTRRRFLQASGACLALPWLNARALAQDDAAAVAADLRAMQGRWILLSWQDDGYDATYPGKGPGEITINDNLFRYEVFGRGRLHDDDQITLDPSKQPKRIHLLNPRRNLPAFRDGDRPLPMNGAYRIDGDELRVSLNMKSGRDISLSLDNSRARPGVRQGTMIDGYREESDKLYVMMREEGYTAGAMATATNLTAGMGQMRRPTWTAGREEGRLASDANWQRLRFWFTATEPGAVRVNLGGDNVLRLGAVTPDQVRGATQGRADLFRYPTATIGDQTSHGGDVPYRANVARLDVEPFVFSVDLRRRDGELRVWMTGQTVMTTRVGAAPSPVNITVGPGVQVRELRWLA